MSSRTLVRTPDGSDADGEPVSTTDSPAEPPAHFGRKPALDGLRAVAVVAVVLYHLGYNWIPGGYLGVDTFFVLSGYLITSLLLVERANTGGIGLGAFWARRARRLLPALLLLLLAVAVWGWLVLPTGELGRLRSDGLASLFYVANWRLVISGQSYFDQYTDPSPLRHLWSLAIEEQFYLLWPIIVLACLALAKGSRRILVGVAVVGAAGSALLMARMYVGADPSRAYYGTDTRAHALLIGVLLAVVLSRWAPRSAISMRTLRALGVVGAIAMVVAFGFLEDRSPFMYRGGAFLFAFAVAAVLAAIVQPGRAGLQRPLTWRAVAWIGAVSYGLYLWHWPVQVALSPDRTGISGWPLDGVRIAVTLGITALSFYLVEQPLRHGTLRGVRLGGAFALGAAVTVVALVLATSGATAPPAYLVSTGQELRSSSSPAPDANGAVTPSGAPKRLLLVGDSVAYTLIPGMQAAATSRGYAFAASTVPGCGLLRGLPSVGGEALPWAASCDRDIPGILDEALAREKPDVVVWLSSWESSDRIVDGKNYRFGTPEADRVVTGLIDETVRRLTATGAKLVILIPAPGAGEEPVAGANARLVALAKLLKKYTADHPSQVDSVDFASAVCPGGVPCPEVVDGIKLRPKDGTHFDDAGSMWAGQRAMELLQPILERR